MLRYFVFFLIVIMVFIVAVVFAAINPAPLRLDLAFTVLEMKTSLALVAFLTAGWLFGMLCAGFLQFNMWAELRRLRKTLQMVEAELVLLRGTSGQDAD